MRILVLGSTGMLGHMAFRVLSKNRNFKVEGTQLEDQNAPYYFNAEDSIKKEFDKYDYLINCIGILSSGIKAGDSISAARAIKINALFPHQFAKLVKGKIIHISTDGVFSGKAENYNEESSHDCLDIYGKTKSLGEVVADNVLNIRTSIIGPSPIKKQGLFEWFMAQPEGEVINGYVNHIWNGVTTLQFAELCAKIIKEDVFCELRNKSSVFHFSPNCPVTKYELLSIFKIVFKKDVIINPVEDPGGPVIRILKTKYEGLKRLFPHGGAMESAIQELKDFIYA
ncbi:MAG: sugar nucleotide-binding protein [Candidatus Omnitrophica bacterium]|nr:sugar nucleotide-binding protein [Candidatus Omnitrophota bacterium]